MAGKISGKEFVKDIRDGMNRDALMAKYGVSPGLLEAMFNKVTAAGILKKGDLPGAAPRRDGVGAPPAPGPVGQAPGGQGEGASGRQMMEAGPPVIDAGLPSIHSAPPAPNRRTPDRGVRIDRGQKSPSSGKGDGLPPGIGEIVIGAILIGIGLVMGSSMFTGDAGVLDWLFDILGMFCICRGVYRMIKKRSIL